MASSDLLKVIKHNLTQKPILDRVFYVPFWECPYNCDFCCVDSLPGKPQSDLGAGEEFLFKFLGSLSLQTNKKVGLHYYGGEPLLKPEEFLNVARRAVSHPAISKVYLYSTLRPPKSVETIKQLPSDKIRVVVNDFTANEKVKHAMQELAGVAEYYSNPTVFHTGRARNIEGEVKKFSSEKIKKTFFEKVLPPSLPGRSCFANASGPLINVAHQKVHLCCLPQSPVVGDFASDTDQLVKKYIASLQEFHKKTYQDMKKCGHTHACQSCEKWSAWDTRKVPAFSI
ncbi:MAG: hypothetical protein CME62_15670 [Halobacteriovoraceae bacterium]|nr:hypothetical protein [Halobacteriovoraceae bacterium]|tara:strand:- start:4453 stop:5304 length:852 start_codon:yes stop_codon:yes gene_type:complete